MKTKIVAIVILSAFLLMMMPSISAVEYQTVKERSAEKAELLQTLTEKLEEMEIPPEIIKLLLLVAITFFGFVIVLINVVLIIIYIALMIVGRLP